MPQMYIPEIGDKITLTKDWTFRVFDEGRNSGLIKLLGLKNFGQHILRESDGEMFFSNTTFSDSHGWGWYSAHGEKLELSHSFWDIRAGRVPGISFGTDLGVEVTLKAGQVLTIDRVYIRRGASDFSSITFNYIGAPKGSGRVRFWAKLADVNNIEFTS